MERVSLPRDGQTDLDSNSRDGGGSLTQSDGGNMHKGDR